MALAGISARRALQANKSEAVRGTLRLDLTDKWQVLVRGEWVHATSTQNIENLSYVVPGFSIAAAAVGAQIGALTLGFQHSRRTIDDRSSTRGCDAPANWCVLHRREQGPHCVGQ